MAERDCFRPPSVQVRRETGGLDITNELIPELSAFLRSLGLVEYVPPIPGPYATVYFARANTSQLSPLKLRWRIYGIGEERTGNFQVSPDDIGVLEAKGKPQRYPFRIETKSRETCSAQTVEGVIAHPGAARVILASRRLEEIPTGYPNGVIDHSSLRVISESLYAGGLLFPSLVIVSNRRHFITDSNCPDRCRITVDRDIMYYGYDPKHRSLFQKPEYLGYDPGVRVEIKTLEEVDITSNVLDWLVLKGKRPYVRNKGQEVYARHYSGFLSSRAIQTEFITKEVSGREIEGKLEVVNTISDNWLEELAATIYEEFDKVGGQDIRVQENLRWVRESSTHCIRYGFVGSEGIFQEAFVITTWPGQRRVGIKRKDKLVGIYGRNQNIFDRTEQREELPFPQWTPYSEEVVISQEARRLGIALELLCKVGESNRHKIRIYLRNMQTNRLYIVSVEESIRCTDGRALRQIEIEYGGRQGTNYRDLDPIVLPAIVGDIEKIQEIIGIIAQRKNINIKRDPITKFEWLRS